MQNFHFQIIIESITGAGYMGDAALDDLKLFTSSCTGNEWWQSFQISVLIWGSARTVMLLTWCDV